MNPTTSTPKPFVERQFHGEFRRELYPCALADCNHRVAIAGEVCVWCRGTALPQSNLISNPKGNSMEEKRNYPQPTGDRVLVRPFSEAEHVGRLVQPETVTKKPTSGVVLAVGPGRRSEFGSVIPVDVFVGDTVHFADYAGQDRVLDGEAVKVLRQDEIELREAETPEPR